MATGNPETIFRSLTDFMGRGALPAAWFCGVTYDLRTGLFADHNVWELAKTWKSLDATDDAGARAVERRLRALGCKGGPMSYEGGRHVYVYKISPMTVE